jgi:hypothetical protein
MRFRNRHLKGVAGAVEEEVGVVAARVMGRARGNLRHRRAKGSRRDSPRRRDRDSLHRKDKVSHKDSLRRRDRVSLRGSLHRKGKDNLPRRDRRQVSRLVRRRMLRRRERVSRRPGK